MAFTSVISRGTQSVALPAVLLLYSYALSAATVPNGVYRATAYAQSGKTASGEITHRHVVAADPDILPLGSRIKIRHAGKYSGEYVVADTGARIQGRRLDIYMPSEMACKKFGSKLVRVKVIQLGDGTQAATKQADRAVKEDVGKEVNKQAVGNAATEEDWAKARAKQAGGSNSKPTSR
ncbi:MAG: 3D domain-containing protein [Bryobacteraceae bacterium]